MRVARCEEETRGGCDQSLTKLEMSLEVSIHAPARGATA